MNISINQITTRRENGEITSVVVHFTARTDDGLVYLSGSVPIENFEDKIDFEGLENEVKDELARRIINGDLNAE